MPEGIGYAGPGDDEETKGKFKEFLKKPENLATAIVFGLALTQPRQGGRNGLETLAQRGAGALAFRGALTRGSQDRQLQRTEQQSVQTARKEDSTLRRDTLDTNVQQNALDRQLRTDLQEDQQAFLAEQNELSAALQTSLAEQERLTKFMEPPTVDDVTKIMESLQFDEAFMAKSPAERWNQAQLMAMMSHMQMVNLLQSGGLAKIQYDDAGRPYIDDGQEAPAAVPTVPATAGENPPAPTQVENPRPASRRGRRQENALEAQQQRETQAAERASYVDALRNDLLYNQAVSPQVLEYFAALPLQELRASGLTPEEIRMIVRAQGQSIKSGARGQRVR